MRFHFSMYSAWKSEVEMNDAGCKKNSAWDGLSNGIIYNFKISNRGYWKPPLPWYPATKLAIWKVSVIKLVHHIIPSFKHIDAIVLFVQQKRHNFY
jgi:hypothetical protein